MAPLSPTINPIGNADFIVDPDLADQIITGTTDAGTSVALAFDGTPLAGSPTVTGTTWTYTLTAADIATLGQGLDKTLTATATDAGGTSTPTTSAPFAVETVPPAIPTINPIGGNDSVVSSQPGDSEVTGTSTVGSTVTLSFNGVPLGTATTIGGNGDWAYALTAANITAIGQGSSKAITATATDAGGTSDPVTSAPFGVDNLAPFATINPIGGVDLIVSAAPPDQVITGTTEAGASVTLTFGAEAPVNATVTGTTWSYTLTAADIAAIGQGSGKTITVTAADAAGNVSSIASAPFAVETVPPAIPTINPIGGVDLIVSAAPPDQVITGTTDAGTSVALAFDGTPLAGSPTVTGTAWSYTLTAADIVAIGQGLGRTLTATATDAGGTSTPATSAPFAVETVPPAIPTINLIGNADSIVDPDPADQIITGTTDAGTTVALAFEGTPLEGSPTVTGTAWSYTLTAADIAAIGQGSGANLIATATDAGGISAPVASAPFAVETVPPAIPTISPIGGVDLIVSAAPPDQVITGTTDAGTSVALAFDGTPLAGSPTVTGTAWSYTLTAADIAAIGQGLGRTLTATATDAGGTTTPVASVPFAVETVPPAIPTINPIGGVDLIVSAAPPDQVITGTTDAGTSVALAFDGTPLAGSPTVTGTAWSYTLTAADIVAIGQGLGRTLTATATDAGGTSTPATSAPFAVETVPPAIPTINLIGNADSIVDPDPADQIITGTTDAGTTVALAFEGTPLEGSPTVAGTAWSYTLTAADIVAIGQGLDKTLTATATDAGGTSTPVASAPFAVETVPPAIPTINPIGGVDLIVSAAPPDQGITGTTDAGTSVALAFDGTPLAGSPTVTGTAWSYTLTAADIATLGQGLDKTLTATATDAGGTSTPTTSAPFAVETVPPAIPTINPIGGVDLIVSAAPPDQVITGTTGAGTSVALTFDGTPLAGSPTVTGTTWSYTLTAADFVAIGQGVGRTLTATATDAGGTSTSTTSAPFAVETVPPAIPTINLIGNADSIVDPDPADQIITGTTDAGTTVALAFEGTPLEGSPTVTGTTWSYTLTAADIAAIGQGSGANLIATATDAGGISAPVASAPFAVETVPPAIPTINPIGGVDLIVSAAPPDQVITGTTDAGTSVALAFDGTPLAGSPTVTGTAWSYTLTAADIVAIGQGLGRTLTATATDAGGTSTPATSAPFAVETVPPAIPTINLIGNADSIVDPDPADQIITGTTDAGTSVALAFDGTPLAGSPTVTGTAWSYTLTAADIVAIGQGLGRTLTATATDAGGTSTPATSAPFAVETVPPAIPTINPIGGVDLIVSAAPPDQVITGTTDAGTSVALAFDGTPLAGSPTVTGTAWSYTLTAADIVAIGQGLGRTATATATDAGGTSTPATSAPFAVETVPPAIPTINLIGNADSIVDPDPADQIITGTTDAGTTVALTFEGTPLEGSPTVTGTTWSYSLTAADIATLGQGLDKTLTATATDAGGTSTPTTSARFAVETVPPAILLQNTSGPLALWQMSSTTIAAGGLVGQNPGPSWFAMGTSAFFTGDTSDVVWQNQNGQVAVWQVQGASLLGGGPVVGNPGPTWHIEGTGHFFGDGNTDILWQNDNGTVALWDMNGTNIVGGGLVTAANPGPTWHIAGTGNFFNDGNTAILFQNDNGSVALWDMNGTNIVGDGLVASNPGPTWHIKGTGDFYGDGHTDILWQNDNGSVALWDMSGTNIVGGGLVTAANPGPAWHIKGTGDFNNDGRTDIAFQNDDGTVAIWEMNGTNIIGGGAVANPGTGWNVFDDNIRFIYSTSANETLAATPTTPDEFVFTSFASGSHTISGFNPAQDMIEFSKAQFASFTDMQAATTAMAGGAMINLGNGSSLLLPGVDPISLHASDFALA